jgi:hypothetical protein
MASARRSLNPRVTIVRTTSRLTGAVTIFSQDLAGDLVFEQRVRQQLFQPVVFDLELFQPLRVRHAHAAELAAPEEITALGEPVLAAEIFHRQARIRFPQKPDDLCFRESLFHHPTLCR